MCAPKRSQTRRKAGQLAALITLRPITTLPLPLADSNPHPRHAYFVGTTSSEARNTTLSRYIPSCSRFKDWLTQNLASAEQQPYYMTVRNLLNILHINCALPHLQFPYSIPKGLGIGYCLVIAAPISVIPAIREEEYRIRDADLLVYGETLSI